MFGRDTKDLFVKPSQVESIVAAMAKVGDHGATAKSKGERSELATRAAG